MWPVWGTVAEFKPAGIKAIALYCLPSIRPPLGFVFVSYCVLFNHFFKYSVQESLCLLKICNSLKWTQYNRSTPFNSMYFLTSYTAARKTCCNCGAWWWPPPAVASLTTCCCQHLFGHLLRGAPSSSLVICTSKLRHETTRRLEDIGCTRDRPLWHFRCDNFGSRKFLLLCVSEKILAKGLFRLRQAASRQTEIGWTCVHGYACLIDASTLWCARKKERIEHVCAWTVPVWNWSFVPLLVHHLNNGRLFPYIIFQRHFVAELWYPC